MFQQLSLTVLSVFSARIMSTTAVAAATATAAEVSGCLSSDSVSIIVTNAGEKDVNGDFAPRPADEIPRGFASTCHENNWQPAAMWKQLSDGKRAWFESANGSYFYWNRGDRHWWLDGPSGAGFYIARDDGQLPPLSGWVPVTPSIRMPAPTIRTTV